MNIAKNMEALFVAALVLIGAASLATAAVPAHHAKAAVSVAAPAAQKMQVIVVSAKRLSAAEKAQLPQ